MIEILLPVYNGEKYLREQIDSFFNQTYQDWVLKIRNDGSTDDSQRIIDEYVKKNPSKVICIDSPPCNIGLIQSLNILAKASPHGDYIMFSDQDDVWLSNKVALSVNEIQAIESKNPHQYIMVCTDAKCVDKDLNMISESFFETQLFPSDTYSDVNKMIALNVTQGCTIIINRVAAQIVFPIPHFMNVHDLYISAKIKSVGGILKYLHKSTLLYRQHGNNELGAVNISLKYYIKRCLKVIETLKILCALKKNLSDRVSISRVVRLKFKYAYCRLVKKSI